ncbi:MAG: type II toxin-antitoxin system Phd/YefM family antitoxin [Terriglobales bacterium]
MAKGVLTDRLPGSNPNDYNDHNDYFRGELDMAQKWTVAEAKAKFSEVIDRAQTAGPQTITRNGRKAAVVVAAEEWERKTKRRGTLAEFFASSPLRGSGIQVKRVRGGVRNADL